MTTVQKQLYSIAILYKDQSASLTILLALSKPVWSYLLHCFILAEGDLRTSLKVGQFNLWREISRGKKP